MLRNEEKGMKKYKQTFKEATGVSTEEGCGMRKVGGGSTKTKKVADVGMKK